mgnify:CR=1 FL=1
MGEVFGDVVLSVFVVSVGLIVDDCDVDDMLLVVCG